MKDGWEKFEILTKFFGSIVLAAIPVMIGVGATKISRSMERAKLVESLIGELTNDERQTRRDLALIALDSAVPAAERCRAFGVLGCSVDETAPDLVADVAIVLWRDLDNQRQSSKAAEILKKRKPDTYEDILGRYNRPISSVNLDTPAEPRAVARQAQAAQIIAQVTTPAAKTEGSLAGVRLVFIQYDRDREQARRVQDALRVKGIAAPGLEQVNGIARNDIRYSGADDRAAAENLRHFLADTMNIPVTGDDIIDLSAKYRVPAGQLELWLKD